MRSLLRILFAVNVFLTGVVLTLCLIMLFVKYAHADEVSAPVKKVKVKADDVSEYAKQIKVKNKIIKVMVIDTGVDADHPLLRHYMPETRIGSKLRGQHPDDYVDEHGHGSHITGIILFGGIHPKPPTAYIHTSDIMCDNVQIFSCKYYDAKGNDLENIRRTVACLQRAYKEKMNVVNYSGGGIAPFIDEYDMIKKLGENHRTLMVAALGNEGGNIDKHPYYPASYSRPQPTRQLAALPNVVGVGSLGKNGKKTDTTNYGVDFPMELGENVLSTLPKGLFGYMSGSSQATALFTHKLLIKKCKELNHK